MQVRFSEAVSGNYLYIYAVVEMAIHAMRWKTHLLIEQMDWSCHGETTTLSLIITKLLYGVVHVKICYD